MTLEGRGEGSLTVGFIRYLSGGEGRITIPDLGFAPVGVMDGWTLKRRGESGPDAALYDFRASFSRLLNKPLFDDPDYEKRVEVVLQRGKSFRVVQEPGHRTSWSGTELQMEGVRLEPIE